MKYFMNEELQLKIEKTLEFLSNNCQANLQVEFLTLLVNFLADLFEADIVWVDHFNPQKPTESETISIFQKGKHHPSFIYQLENTPARNVIGKDFYCIQQNIRQLFPADEWLEKKKIEGYAAIPLWDSNHSPIGSIAVFSKKPINDCKPLEMVLKIASLKASEVLCKLFNEDKLQKQTQLFDSIFETTPVGLMITNNNGVIRKANQIMCHLFGYSQIELENIKEEILFADAEPAQVASELLASATHQYPAGLKVYQCKKKNGELFYAEVFYSKILDEQDKWTGNIGIFRDISDLQKLIEDSKIARENAEAFKNKYSSLFERTLDGIYRSTHDGKFLDINPAMVRMFGYSSIKEMMAVDIKHELYFAVEDRTSISLETGREEVEIFRMRKKDGSEIWVEDHGLFVKNEKNEVEYHIGILRDVTEEIRSKAELKTAIHEIELSEKQYRELIEFAPDAFFQGDEKGNIIGLNNKSIALSGYSRKELLAMNMNDFFKKDELEKAPLQYDQLKQGHTVINEREMICKDGSTRFVEMNSKLLPNGLPVSFFRDISSRKLAERALKESEEKYKAVFNNAPLGIFHFNKSAVITDFNDAFIHILGSKRELLLGLNMLYQLRDKKLIAQIEKTLLEGSGYYEGNYASVTSGKITPTIVHLSALRSANGEIIGGVGIVKDVSEQKEQKDKLQASNQRILKQNEILADVSLIQFLRSGEVEKLAEEINFSIANAFNIQRVSVWLFNDDETELVCISIYDLIKNKFSSGEVLHEHQFKSEFEYLKNEKYIDANNTFTDIRTAGYIEKYMKPLDIRSMLDGVIRIRGKNVGVLCLEYVSEFHNWEPDEIAFVCQLADQIGMTIQNYEIKKNEEELIKLSRAVDQSPSSIVITDLSGAIEYVNQKFVEITGFTFDEVKGKTTRILKSGKTPGWVYKDLWKTIQEGKSWTGEILNRRKNGEFFWESVLISPIVNSEGDAKFYLAVKEDISEKKKMIEELIVAKEKAEESNRMKSAFLSTMSHELRTPLNAIIGLSELINSEQNIEKIIKYTATITSSGYQLLSVVNDVMDISLIESGEAKVHKQNTPIVRLMFEVYEILKVEQRRMKKEHIDFQLLLPNHNHDLVIYTDHNKVKQIFINLLKNAFKFTDQGHVYYGFSMVKNQGVNMVRFYVEDSGIGISSEKHQVIFESFRQVQESNTRNYGGVGIGLSISKKTTELLGGEIWVDSEAGKGATFYFTLPFEKIEE